MKEFYRIEKRYNYVYDPSEYNKGMSLNHKIVSAISVDAWKDESIARDIFNKYKTEVFSFRSGDTIKYCIIEYVLIRDWLDENDEVNYELLEISNM